MLEVDLRPRTISRVENGKIIPTTNLELIVTDHCNISCQQCNHASPVMRKWNADLQQTERVLRVLSNVYHCDRLRLLGGEPLLHPDLTNLIHIGRASGIGNTIHLITNGVLLDRLPDEAWRALDVLEISVYQNAGLSKDLIKAARRKGDKLGTEVQIAHYPKFRHTFSLHKAQTPKLVEDIWTACKMANVWGCHSLRGDHMFRCPQSIYVPPLTGGHLTDEGFAITSEPDLRDRLIAFLNGAGPLRSCANCVGSCGKQFNQTGSPRKSWKDDLQAPMEDIVDYALLAQSMTNMQVIDDCRMPERRKRGLGPAIARKFRQLL
jgi:organic radical activating enzyme